MKVYVAGHTGLVGGAIIRQIDRERNHSWIGKTRSELDLTNRDLVFDYLNQEKPDVVIIAAAMVGGIKANADSPVDFLSKNLQIQTNLIDASHNSGVERLIFLGSSCVYPKFADQPIKEDYLLTGKLEETNEAYALAKISGIKLVQSYRIQHQKRWISAMPTNLYGPGDSYDLDTSHVLPAIIRKMHNAKVSGESEVTLWGTGNPKREFLYVDDLADALLYLLEKYDDIAPINIGTGVDISINELAFKIAEVVGFGGKIIWDSSKPDGTPRKLLDVSKINSLGWKHSTTLGEGLQLTFNDFLSTL